MQIVKCQFIGNQTLNDRITKSPAAMNKTTPTMVSSLVTDIVYCEASLCSRPCLTTSHSPQVTVQLFIMINFTAKYYIALVHINQCN